MSAHDSLVPVTAMIPASVYRTLQPEAHRRNSTVSYLVVEHAIAHMRSSRPEITQEIPTPKRTYTRMTRQMIARAAELQRQGHGVAAIARDLGIARSTVHNHMTQIVNYTEEQA